MVRKATIPDAEMKNTMFARGAWRVRVADG